MAHVVIRGCAIILGTYFGVLADCWVPFRAVPGILGTFFGIFPEFWVSFLAKIPFLQEKSRFLGIDFDILSTTL